jgi:hypothetical protein
MLHDPDIYADPMRFNPDRFKGDDVEMERAKDLVFGFGRRYSSGKDFAEGTVFAVIATTLAACDVLPGLDPKGKEVIPEYAYTNGLAMYVPTPYYAHHPSRSDTNQHFKIHFASFPETFTLRARARSPQAAALFEEASTIVE